MTESCAALATFLSWRFLYWMKISSTNWKSRGFVEAFRRIKEHFLGMLFFYSPSLTSCVCQKKHDFWAVRRLNSAKNWSLARTFLWSTWAFHACGTTLDRDLGKDRHRIRHSLGFLCFVVDGQVVRKAGLFLVWNYTDSTLSVCNGERVWPCVAPGTRHTSWICPLVGQSLVLLSQASWFEDGKAQDFRFPKDSSGMLACSVDFKWFPCRFCTASHLGFLFYVWFIWRYAWFCRSKRTGLFSVICVSQQKPSRLLKATHFHRKESCQTNHLISVYSVNKVAFSAAGQSQVHHHARQ